MQDHNHCCAEMATHITDAEVALVYVDRFRLYGIEYRDGNGSIQQILFCPWCGTKLSKELRDEWFAILDELGLEPDDPSVPDEMRSDAWWRARDL